MTDTKPDARTDTTQDPLLPWAPVEAFTLTAFAIAQPLYSLLGANATFFAANRVSGTEIVWFALAVLLVPGILVAAFDVGLVLLGRGWRAQLHATLLGVLASLTVGPPALRLLGATGALYVTGLVVLAAALAVAITRIRVLRQLARWASFAPAMFVFLFLFSGPVSDLRSSGSTTASSTGATTDADAPSLAVLVFDQLPLSLMVDATGELDAERFPGFAALAERSTWYREATTIAANTNLAVPSLLTGTVPQPDDLPVLSDHPTNLFTILGETHEVYADEYVTQMCPDQLCGDQPEAPSTLVKDTAIVAVNVLLDERTAGALVPAVDGRWNDFSGEYTVTGEADSTEAVRTKRRAAADDSVRFEAYIEALGGLGDPDDPALAYLHLFHPHEPYRYLPDGRQHNQGGPFAVDDEGRWPDNQPMMDTRLQHYLAQAMNADREVAAVLERLDETGAADDTILVVTSDHGVGMVPGMPNKLADRGTPPGTLTELLAVPLFVSVPGSPPAVSDAPVQLPDVLPGLLGEMGIDPAELDLEGVPLDDADEDHKPVLLTAEGPAPMPQRAPLKDSSTPRRVEELMPVAGAPWAFGPAAGMLGLPAPEITPEDTPLTAALEQPPPNDGSADGIVPTVVNATVSGAEEPVGILVVMDGAVVGGGTTFREQDAWHLSALVDPAAVTGGRPEPELLSVDDGAFHRIAVG